jgi:hypothetical protein
VSDAAKAAIRAARGWGMAYLGSPFTLHPRGHWPAYVEAAKGAAALVRAGVKVFSPIIHGYALSQYGGIPAVNPAMWAAINRPFVERADGLVVLELTHWETSAGLLEEIKAFTTANKPIVHLTLADLE